MEITITNGGIVRGLLSHCIRVLMITHSLDVGISLEVKNRTAATGGLFFTRIEQLVIWRNPNYIFRRTIYEN